MAFKVSSYVNYYLQILAALILQSIRPLCCGSQQLLPYSGRHAHAILTSDSDSEASSLAGLRKNMLAFFFLLLQVRTAS